MAVPTSIPTILCCTFCSNLPQCQRYASQTPGFHLAHLASHNFPILSLFLVQAHVIGLAAGSTTSGGANLKPQDFILHIPASPQILVFKHWFHVLAFIHSTTSVPGTLSITGGWLWLRVPFYNAQGDPVILVFCPAYPCYPTNVL